MISISEVYDAVRDLANKDQKGFVTPAVFNTFASVAQQTVYNKIFERVAEAKALRRSGADPGMHLSVAKQAEEDLSYYISERALQELIEADEYITTGNGDIELEPDNYIEVIRPLDIKKVISIRTSESRDSIEIVHDASKMNRILTSNLSYPTQDFPVAFVKNNKIEVYPDTLAIDSVVVLFYRQPRSRYASGSNAGYEDLNRMPSYAAINVNQSTGYVIQDVANSRNFDLPEHYKTDLIYEMSKLIGIRLRDAFVSNQMNIEDSKQ